MSKPFKKESKFIKASDNWSPCYPNNEVMVSVVRDSSQMFRVCVWGEDDTGMEKLFDHKGDARDFYNNLSGPVSMDLLKKLGFISA
jgi:hypothetical protein